MSPGCILGEAGGVASPVRLHQFDVVVARKGPVDNDRIAGGH